MSKLQAAGLGAILGLFLSLMYICDSTERMEAEKNREIAEIHETVYVPVSKQVSKDADIILNDWYQEEQNLTAPYENIPLKAEYQNYLEQRCADYGTDFFLVIALMESESQFDEEAEGDNGNSIGLMQINNVWWETMSNKGLDIFDSKDNIEAGLIILTSYLEKYADEATAIQMYKCGETRGRELLSSGIILTQCTDVVNRAEEIKKETAR